MLASLWVGVGIVRRVSTNTRSVFERQLAGFPASRLDRGASLWAMLCIAMAVSLILAACGRSGLKSGSKFSKRVVALGQPVPKGGGRYKVGKPYQINGRWFHPREDPRYDKVGVASWYGELFHGRYTANGEIYDMNALSAAHPTLPLPVYARVTNLSNGRSLVVRVNDRGPYAHDRIIDLSKRSAQLLGFQRNGTTQVRVQYLARAPMSGDDTYERQMLVSQRWARTAGLTGPPRSSAAPPWKATPEAEGDAISLAQAKSQPSSKPAFEMRSGKQAKLSRTFETAAEKVEVSHAKTRDEPSALVRKPDAKSPVEADPIVTAAIPAGTSQPPGGPSEFAAVSPKKRLLFVQSGAFRLRSNAERLEAKLSRLGPTEITPATVSGTLYHRVRLGPFAARALADETLKKVVEAGATGASVVGD